MAGEIAQGGRVLYAVQLDGETELQIFTCHNFMFEMKANIVAFLFVVLVCSISVYAAAPPDDWLGIDHSLYSPIVIDQVIGMLQDVPNWERVPTTSPTALTLSVSR